MNRAYSILTVKSVNEDQRIITGTATTPAPDRVGDVVDPLGVKFKNPMPLLWQHQSGMPIGNVTFSKPTKNGIDFTAKLPRPQISETLKARVDEAWESVKLGLVSGVSIGFRPLEYSIMDDGGYRFVESEVMELSLVTIPANAEATIQFVKSLDQEQLAATGRKLPSVVRLDPPGASGKSKTPKPQEGKMSTTAEHITLLEGRLVGAKDAQAAILAKAMEEGRSTDTAEQDSFDEHQSTIDTVNRDLKMYRTMEKNAALGAKPVIKTPVADADGGGDGIEVRHGISVKAPPKLAPGIAFAQYAKCMALSAKMYRDPAHIAEQLYGPQSIVVGALKTAVGAGSNVSANWAANLVGAETTVFADFVEYLRPRTIIGQFGANGIPSLRDVPFRTALITQSAAGSGYWVGEGKAKPLTSMNFTRTTLVPLKVANICVLTDESIRDSSPKSDAIVRDELVMALTARLDQDFIDPSKTASAGVSPASITNGAHSIASTGTDEAAARLDIRGVFDVFDAADNPPEAAVLIMSPRVARGLAGLYTDLGQKVFPTMSVRGGTVDGTPVIVSRYVDNNVILVNASDIYLGDEGGVSVDMSSEASLEMSDAPSHNSTTPTAAQLVSMFQTNSVAIRAERTINWARRRTASVAYLTGVQWGGDLPTV
jgi:HK97 family phage prohead protease